MKNKKFIISTAELNTTNIQEITTYLDIPITSVLGNIENRRHYPIRVNFINKSGKDVNVNIFSSEAEIDDYTADPTNYDFFTIATGTTTYFTARQILPTAYKIFVVCPTGGASGNFEIECIGYQSKNL